MDLPQDIIRHKRNGNALSHTQIKQFVKGLADNSFTDAQTGAMAMAIWLNGMENQEKVDFTLAMRDSGTVMSWKDVVDGPVVDKHSTGGVGDKVSLMLAPIVAACGAYVPMISGRGLGHTGGTADKLEAIPGFNVQPSLSEFKQLVKEHGTAIISQTSDLAPADKRLYAIRDVTGTVESIPLITASILSKKLAAGLDSLIMDVKVGNGAMMDNMDDAKELARSIVDVANSAGVRTEALITDMNQVLGHTAGNAVEVVETVEYLNGTYQEPRLHEVVMALAQRMVIAAGIESDEAKAMSLVEDALSSGKAADVFERMVVAMGGCASLMKDPKTALPQANVVKPILAKSGGYISAVDTRAIGMAVVRLGGGRISHTDAVDHSVGYSKIQPIGSKITKGDVLAWVHAKSEDDALVGAEEFHAATKMSDDLSETSPVIYFHIT